ncbi:hypothetical protein BKA69DRAFT_1045978 [Paraphysoderma sedebokerense]|nr:hypothetical protein BKA69DRAFT_1045978 [Paraphysoderma sedebokerense]
MLSTQYDSDDDFKQSTAPVRPTRLKREKINPLPQTKTPNPNSDAKAKPKRGRGKKAAQISACRNENLDSNEIKATPSNIERITRPGRRKGKEKATSDNSKATPAGGGDGGNVNHRTSQCGNYQPIQPSNVNSKTDVLKDIDSKRKNSAISVDSPQDSSIACGNDFVPSKTACEGKTYSSRLSDTAQIQSNSSTAISVSIQPADSPSHILIQKLLTNNSDSEDDDFQSSQTIPKSYPYGQPIISPNSNYHYQHQRKKFNTDMQDESLHLAIALSASLNPNASPGLLQPGKKRPKKSKPLKLRQQGTSTVLSVSEAKVEIENRAAMLLFGDVEDHTTRKVVGGEQQHLNEEFRSSSLLNEYRDFKSGAPVESLWKACGSEIHSLTIESYFNGVLPKTYDKEHHDSTDTATNFTSNVSRSNDESTEYPEKKSAAERTNTNPSMIASSSLNPSPSATVSATTKTTPAVGSTSKAHTEARKSSQRNPLPKGTAPPKPDPISLRLSRIHRLFDRVSSTLHPDMEGIADNNPRVRQVLVDVKSKLFLKKYEVEERLRGIELEIEKWVTDIVHTRDELIQNILENPLPPSSQSSQPSQPSQTQPSQLKTASRIQSPKPADTSVSVPMHSCSEEDQECRIDDLIDPELVLTQFPSAQTANNQKFENRTDKAIVESITSDTDCDDIGSVILTTIQSQLVSMAAEASDWNQSDNVELESNKRDESVEIVRITESNNDFIIEKSTDEDRQGVVFEPFIDLPRLQSSSQPNVIECFHNEEMRLAETDVDEDVEIPVIAADATSFLQSTNITSPNPLSQNGASTAQVATSVPSEVPLSPLLMPQCVQAHPSSTTNNISDDEVIITQSNPIDDPHDEFDHDETTAYVMYEPPPIQPPTGSAILRDAGTSASIFSSTSNPSVSAARPPAFVTISDSESDSDLDVFTQRPVPTLNSNQPGPSATAQTEIPIQRQNRKRKLIQKSTLSQTANAGSSSASGPNISSSMLLNQPIVVSDSDSDVENEMISQIGYDAYDGFEFAENAVSMLGDDCANADEIEEDEDNLDAKLYNFIMERKDIHAQILRYEVIYFNLLLFSIPMILF